jgi:hypothetical protein
MDPTDPIRRVSAVSTGRVQIHPDHQAARLPALDRARPINAYVIEYREGLELGHVPGVGSRRSLRDSTAMINTMRQRDPGLVILPAYDPAAASRLAQVTDWVPALATV